MKIIWRQQHPYINSTSGKEYYIAPCVLRPAIQPEAYGLKIKVVLKWRNNCIENIRFVSQIISDLCH